MNWVDLAVLGFLTAYTVLGLWEGFVQRAFFAATFVAALGFALALSSPAGDFLQRLVPLPAGWERAAGFLALFLVVTALGSALAGMVLRRIPPPVLASPLNRLLGVLPSVFSGLVITAFALTLIVALPASPRVKAGILDSTTGGFLVEQAAGAEMTLLDIFGEPINDTLTFLTTIRPESREEVDLDFRTTDVQVDPGSEERLLELVNRERLDRGLAPLELDAALRAVARQHAADMFAGGYFSHYNLAGASPFDRLRAAGLSFSLAGENLAYAPTVEVAHGGLMRSPGHRQNILDPRFCRVGIGVVDGGVYGRMFVQEFAC